MYTSNEFSSFILPFLFRSWRTVWYLSDSTKFHKANSCDIGKPCISGTVFHCGTEVLSYTSDKSLNLQTSFEREDKNISDSLRNSTRAIYLLKEEITVYLLCLVSADYMEWSSITGLEWQSLLVVLYKLHFLLTILWFSIQGLFFLFSLRTPIY